MGQEERKMERGLYIQRDDPLFEHPSDHDLCPRLDAYRQPKNMRTDDAENHFVSSFLILSVTSLLIYPPVSVSPFLRNFLP